MTRITIRPVGGFSTAPAIGFEAHVSIGPSVRDSQPVHDAQHQAEVAKCMKNFEMPRGEAERFLEIEQQYKGIGLPRGDQ